LVCRILGRIELDLHLFTVATVKALVNG